MIPGVDNMLIVPSLPEIMGALSKTSVFISHATEMGSGLNIGRLSSMEIWPGAPFSTRLITAAALRTATELLLENRLKPGEIERRKGGYIYISTIASTTHTRFLTMR